MNITQLQAVLNTTATFIRKRVDWKFPSHHKIVYIPNSQHRGGEGNMLDILTNLTQYLESGKK